MPKPVLQAMVLADNVYKDERTGKHIIAGTFTAIFAANPESPGGEHHDAASGQKLKKIADPRRMGSPYLYLALRDVHGTVPIELRYVRLADSSLVFKIVVNVTSPDPVEVMEYAIPIPLLPSDKAGVFSLDALYEDEILGSWRISVRTSEQPTSEG